MYGVLVGKARQPIQAGEVLTTRNVRHEASRYSESSRRYKWFPSRCVSVAAANLPRIPQARWEVASGQLRTKAELLGQDDFIPWKRGVSL
jgi:hypothetical protein